ncbi:unnamed protein product [Prunus brigantina]
MDYDIALKWDALQEPAADATADVKRKYERWEKANRMATLIMLKTMTPSLRGSIPRSDCAKDFLVSIGQKFKESEKGEKGVLLNKLTEMKYDGRGCVRAHIMNMADIENKLKGLNMTIDDDMMVHFALNSLPKEFKTLKSSYVAQKESWTLNDLITISVQEENNIIMEMGQKTVNMVQDYRVKQSKEKKGNFAEKKGNFAEKKGNFAEKKDKENTKMKEGKPTGLKCYFCRKFGHMKRNCTRYQRWLEKQKNKGKIENVLVCFESNLIDVSTDT